MKDGTALVDAIEVDGRFRQDLGDVGPLSESIATVGLLHPIVVTSDLRLIAGQRRLEAVRKLGWHEVPVRIVDDLDSTAALLVAERDENTCRKDMASSELYALGAALTDLERPAATQRQKAGTAVTDPTRERAQGPVSEVVGPAVGMSDASWRRLKVIGDRAAEGDADAQAVMDRIDAGKCSIYAGYNLLRESDKARKGKSTKRTHKPSDERAEQIRELATQGHVSQQIAKKLGVSAIHVRKLARDAGITLPDEAIGKRRLPDANRIVRETVAAAEGAAFGLDLIDLEELDRSQIDEWTSSLSDSIRALNRLTKQLKELVS